MGGRTVWIGLASIVVGLLGVTAWAAPPATSQAPDAKQFDEQFRPFLARHCVGCHSGEKPKGNLRLDNLAPDFADTAAREQWAAVIERLTVGRDASPREAPPASRRSDCPDGLA